VAWTKRPTHPVSKAEEERLEMAKAYHDGQKQSGRREAAFHGLHNALLKISQGVLSQRVGVPDGLASPARDQLARHHMFDY
jgi:hypothetical protein